MLYKLNSLNKDIGKKIAVYIFTNQGMICSFQFLERNFKGVLGHTRNAVMVDNDLHLKYLGNTLLCHFYA